MLLLMAGNTDSGAMHQLYMNACCLIEAVLQEGSGSWTNQEALKADIVLRAGSGMASPSLAPKHEQRTLHSLRQHGSLGGMSMLIRSDHFTSLHTKLIRYLALWMGRVKSAPCLHTLGNWPYQ